MSRMRGVWRAAAPLVVVGLLVGGCTGEDPEPVTTPSPVEVEPTPSPSPTRDLTKRPERPEAMDEPTTDGAIAAATYVLELYGYSFATGDLRPWNSITRETCGFCGEVGGSVREMVDAGETSSGSSFVVDSSTAQEISEDEWFSVELTITQSSSERYDSDGRLIGTGEGGQHRAVFALSWSDGWYVDEMGILPIEEDSASEEQ